MREEQMGKITQLHGTMNFDGGRAFYTGGGHTEASFDEPNFRQHLLGAMEWCLRRK